ncbi:ECF-type sigma factor [Roseateles sp.]|uniref:ECF-type sigma factor n=1 Tax=Roseateles sp. TaxID=1971397 RepID=UPI003267CF32
MDDITALLHSAKEGDAKAIAGLFQALYPDLRRIARKRLSIDERGTLLDTTALVHECYMKFARAQRLSVDDRNHFMAYAATAMRSIVVDFARARLTERRGGHAQHETLNSTLIGSIPGGEAEVLAVHEALDDLATFDPRLARVVEMRYFGGLADAEIADALGVGLRTVRRDWEKARLILSATLRG